LKKGSNRGGKEGEEREREGGGEGEGKGESEWHFSGSVNQ